MTNSMKYFAALLVVTFMTLGTPALADHHGEAQTTTFLVFSSAIEGREDEYNNWYETIHMAEVLALPGFVSAQRYQVADDGTGGAKTVAVYELVGDPQAALAALAEAVASTMNMSDSMDPASVVTKLLSARTAKMVAAE